MKNMSRFPLIAMLLMAVLSCANLFGLSIAGLAVILGVACFFIQKALTKQTLPESGLDIRAIGKQLKDRKLWIWIALPLLMDVVCYFLGKSFVPGYVEHVLGRVDTILSLDQVALLVVQLAVLALGEEIAWRGFFQNQLSKALPLWSTLIIPSLFFAIGHVAAGNLGVVIYDVFFIFVNSILYGVIFQKTQNAWISGISHFAANLFSLLILF
jgi:membrane protease YdiL (CAAX protease family)